VVPRWPATANAGYAVREEQAEQPRVVIKVYNRLPRDAYFAIAEESARQGLSFAGHVPNAVAAGEASDAHQKSIELLTGILSSVSSEEAEVRKRAAEVSAAGNAAVGISAESRAALRALQERILATYDARRRPRSTRASCATAPGCARRSSSCDRARRWTIRHSSRIRD